MPPQRPLSTTSRSSRRTCREIPQSCGDFFVESDRFPPKGSFKVGHPSFSAAAHDKLFLKSDSICLTAINFLAEHLALSAFWASTLKLMVQMLGRFD